MSAAPGVAAAHGWASSMRHWGGRFRRLLRQPPQAIARRVWSGLEAEADVLFAGRRGRAWGMRQLLSATGCAGIDELWAELGRRPYVTAVEPVERESYRSVCPGDEERILRAADAALAHRVDLLGSGPIELGEKIDWSKDYKTGYSWPSGYMRHIDYNNPDRPSDVKMAWEVSRVQWLIPAGQAYLLTGDDRYAAGVRGVLEDWIDANPYALTVNWSCTLEAALRILSWTWLFRALHSSPSWSDPGFRARFLVRLYLHAEFTERYFERSDVNGNHFTADAAALVCAGLFFGHGQDAEQWQRRGWQWLEEDLPRQVSADGVDFEGSLAYHRFVLESFLIAALYRRRCGLEVSAAYRDRLIEMARFVTCYSKPDGRAPLVGDMDDARALPFGGQDVNDHRYLPGIIGVTWDVPELIASASGPRAEAFWWLGPEGALRLPSVARPAPTLRSQAFRDGGFYVMRNERDHIFIDCGPVGQAGRGGHGHNDCLSFEAALDGEALVSDCGAFVYTASYEERNRFRSTAYHNTPQVDGEEINRFIHSLELWRLHADAEPDVRVWRTGPEYDMFRGAHLGYRRLTQPVTPVRTILLDHRRHALIIRDEFEGDGAHEIAVPLHFAPGIEVSEAPESLILNKPGRSFRLCWRGTGWRPAVGPARVSPRYGVTASVARAVWRSHGRAEEPLIVCLAPADRQGGEIEWALSRLREIGLD